MKYIKYLLIIFLVYTVLAFFVREMRIDFASADTLDIEMMGISESKTSVFFNEYYELQVKDLSNTGLKIGSVLLTTDQKNKFYHAGTIASVKIDKDRCSTWTDFYKMFGNYYDYNLLSIKIIKSVDSTPDSQKKSAELPSSAWINALIFIFVYTAVNYVLTRMAFKKYNPSQTEWTFNTPSWLERTQLLFFLVAMLFGGYLAYYYFTSGSASGQWGTNLIILVALIWAVYHAIGMYRSWNNYIKITETEIEFYNGKKEYKFPISSISAIEYSKSTMFVGAPGKLIFMLGEEKFQLDFSEMKMSSFEDKILLVFKEMLKTQNITWK